MPTEREYDLLYRSVFLKKGNEQAYWLLGFDKDRYTHHILIKNKYYSTGVHILLDW